MVPWRAEKPMHRLLLKHDLFLALMDIERMVQIGGKGPGAVGLDMVQDSEAGRALVAYGGMGEREGRDKIILEAKPHRRSADVHIQGNLFSPCRRHDIFQMPAKPLCFNLNTQGFAHPSPPADDTIEGENIVQQTFPVDRRHGDIIAIQRDNSRALFASQRKDKGHYRVIRLTA